MNNHLILISRERIIGTEVDETSNLIYTEIKIRSKKYDGEYVQSKDYPHLVEKELTKAEIANFKANRHLYTKVATSRKCIGRYSRKKVILSIRIKGFEDTEIREINGTKYWVLKRDLDNL